MKLTKIQEAWLVSLETSPPEKQLKGALGVKEKEDYKACCLGELHIIGCKINNKPSPWRNNKLVSGEDEGVLHLNYKKYGLRDSVGSFKAFIRISDISCTCLSQMNDSFATWKEIAAYIRANPENVFTNE